IAMPEIHIGLFPDVGGGYFLNLMPDGIGALMALTGLVVTEGDAMYAGLADIVVEAVKKDAVIDALKRLDWSDDPIANHSHITDHLSELERIDGDPPSELAEYGDDTRALVQCDSAIAYRDALNALAARNPYFASAAKNLAQGSPTAAHVTFEYLHRTKGMAIDEVLAMDLVLAKQFQRHHDFSEGVRALLIDKDKAPQWSPREWTAIDRALVAQHFSSL
ncbi:MAG: enoyl-CoA hydratase/isomerase family protein, partial [Casimicrobium sp.]